MQTKVSLVITCYNKASCIGSMLDSIIAQDWNNIEVIMVDDGSIDGTYDVIAKYAPKLKMRGFDVIVHRQKNLGVAKASKKGLELVSGDYVSLIDADDTLEPVYVSAMANFLDENEIYDIVKCGWKATDTYGGVGEHIDDDPLESSDDRAIKYILQYPKIITSAWLYMVRVSYLNTCSLPENYYSEIRTTQEPSFVLPLLIHSGKLKNIRLPLYCYIRDNANASIGIRSNQTWEYMNLKINGRYDIIENVISSINPEFISDYDRKRYIFFSKFGRYSELCKYAYIVDNFKAAEENFLLCLNVVSKRVNIKVEKYTFEKSGFGLLQAIKLAFFDEPSYTPPKFNGRVIAYGVLGNIGKQNLRYLYGTMFDPDELWDIAGDGVTVIKPQFETLTTNDRLVLFPIYVNIVNADVVKFDMASCIVRWVDIEGYILNMKFQEITKMIKDKAI